MKKILILGEGGYIGGSFCQYMSRFDGYSVDTVSTLDRKWEEFDFSPYDAVYNVSGLAHANARQASEELYYDVNGRLPVEMAQKAKHEGVPLFIHMSSMIIYGDMSALGKQKMISADTVPDSDGVYGKSKLMAEKGLAQLADDSFRVAVMRPPLIYGENARDNFPRLVKFAMTFPVFPRLKNTQSMVYIDNLCELVRLIIDNSQGGYFYPQQEEYIETSKIVKDIAVCAGHKIIITPVFNPALRVLSHGIGFIRKAFGNLTYEHEMSEHFGGAYRVVSYSESVKRIAESRK